MIFITGQHASGKTRFAELYQRKFGYHYIDLGPTLRKHWLDNCPDIRFADFIAQGESECGPDFTNIILARAVEAKLRYIKEEGQGKDLLVVGSRSVEGINYLRSNIPVINGNPRVIVYLKASEKVLFKRYRMREGRDITLEEFKVLLEEDARRGVLGIESCADYVVNNEGNSHRFEGDCLGLKLCLKPEGHGGGPERY